MAAIMDIIAATLLSQTDFNNCAYTPDSMEIACNNPSCSQTRLPPNTCYCCELLESQGDRCKVPFLLGRQYYFSQVESCQDINEELELFLAILVVLHCVNVLLAIAGIFRTSPVIDRDLEYVKLNRFNRAKGGRGGGVAKGKTVKGQVVTTMPVTGEREKFKDAKRRNDNMEDSFTDNDDDDGGDNANTGFLDTDDNSEL